MRRRTLGVAASFVVMVIGIGIATWLHNAAGPTYETGIGQQESIGLADGSTIELNTLSKIRIHVTEHRRSVELLEGQALFRVARDATRPFVVESDGTRIRAVGTQFDVYRKSSRTTVTVVEGRVAVLPNHSHSGEPPAALSERIAPALRQEPPFADAHALLLDAGDQVTLTPGAEPTPGRADVAAATAWTQRRLVFDASTLAEVIEEFNRYNPRRLVLRDASLAGFPITGSFSSTDPASLVHFLQMQPGVRVTVRSNEIEIAAAR